MGVQRWALERVSAPAGGGGAGAVPPEAPGAMATAEPRVAWLGFQLWLAFLLGYLKRVGKTEAGFSPPGRESLAAKVGQIAGNAASVFLSPQGGLLS